MSMPDYYLMFFTTGNKMGRASSNGTGFVVDPQPVIGQLAPELLSERIILDGSVFKMFYSFKQDPNGDDSPCLSSWAVGYATSSDGYNWVPSPSNPVLDKTSPKPDDWDANVSSFLVGSVVSTDGNNPANGLSLYYSVYPPGSDPSQCRPNGIGLARRSM